MEESAVTARGENSPAGKALFWIGVVVSLGHVYLNVWGTMDELFMAALHFGAFGLMVALAYPLTPVIKPGARAVVLILDGILGLLAVACALYLIWAITPLYERGQSFIATDWLFAGLAILLALEFTRRATGWLIPIIILVSLTYVVLWGQWIGGVFHFPGLTWETLFFRSYFSDGLFGPIATISYSYVFMFILFGAFLVRSGAGDFIIDLSRAVAGRLVGGPGLVAVFGSGLMGSISGSAVANTVSTGVITIPLMRKAGYRPKFAAGVEAAASTGGQLMPPIMGAGAFIMANFTQIPYLTIVAMSVLPAMLYFLSVAFFVRVEAKRLGLVDDGSAREPILAVLARGWHFLLPIAALVFLLIQGFTPTYAAGLAILCVVGASWLSRSPMGPWAILEALAKGARNCAGTAILLVAVGLVVNVISTTGVGNTFSLMIADWSGGSLLITLILVALASLVLGMGLPVTAAYIVLGTLSAPAIYGLMAEARLIELIAAGNVPEQAAMIAGALMPELAAALSGPVPAAEAAALVAGMPTEVVSLLIDQSFPAEALAMILLSAHLIIFWLSQDSNVTPPVCLTAFAAAAIAGTKPMATGVSAWKIAKGLYLIPLLFAYTPFIGGPPAVVAAIFVTAVIALYGFAGAFQGYLEGPLSWIERGVLFIASGALMWPHHVVAIDAAGIVVIVGLVLWSRRRVRPPERVGAR